MFVYIAFDILRNCRRVRQGHKIFLFALLFTDIAFFPSFINLCSDFRYIKCSPPPVFLFLEILLLTTGLMTCFVFPGLKAISFTPARSWGLWCLDCFLFGYNTLFFCFLVFFTNELNAKSYASSTCLLTFSGTSSTL